MLVLHLWQEGYLADRRLVCQGRQAVVLALLSRQPHVLAPVALGDLLGGAIGARDEIHALHHGSAAAPADQLRGTVGQDGVGEAPVRSLDEGQVVVLQGAHGAKRLRLGGLEDRVGGGAEDVPELVVAAKALAASGWIGTRRRRHRFGGRDHVPIVLGARRRGRSRRRGGVRRARLRGRRVVPAGRGGVARERGGATGTMMRPSRVGRERPIGGIRRSPRGVAAAARLLSFAAGVVQRGPAGRATPPAGFRATRAALPRAAADADGREGAEEIPFAKGGAGRMIGGRFAHWLLVCFEEKIKCSLVLISVWCCVLCVL